MHAFDKFLIFNNLTSIGVMISTSITTERVVDITILTDAYFTTTMLHQSTFGLIVHDYIMKALICWISFIQITKYVYDQPIVTPPPLANTSLFSYNLTPNYWAEVSYLTSYARMAKKSLISMKAFPMLAILLTHEGIGWCNNASLKQLVKVLQFLRMTW